MLELGTKFLLSYFIGSIMGSMVIGRLRGGVDIRDLGSGNAGGTNALRTQGWMFACGVILIDVGKGAIATGLIPDLNLPFVSVEPELSRVWLTLCCAAAAVIGHVWPMWYNFRGGKGAATLVGTMLVLDASILVPLVAVWLITLIVSGYVGLSTILAGIAAPVFLLVTRLPADQPLFIYTVALALYILFSHRSNVLRMRQGTEPRVGRAMLFDRSR